MCPPREATATAAWGTSYTGGTRRPRQQRQQRQAGRAGRGRGGRAAPRPAEARGPSGRLSRPSATIGGHAIAGRETASHGGGHSLAWPPRSGRLDKRTTCVADNRTATRRYWPRFSGPTGLSLHASAHPGSVGRSGYMTVAWAAGSGRPAMPRHAPPAHTSKQTQRCSRGLAVRAPPWSTAWCGRPGSARTPRGMGSRPARRLQARPCPCRGRHWPRPQAWHPPSRVKTSLASLAASGAALPSARTRNPRHFVAAPVQLRLRHAPQAAPSPAAGLGAVNKGRPSGAAGHSPASRSSHSARRAPGR